MLVRGAVGFSTFAELPTGLVRRVQVYLSSPSPLDFLPSRAKVAPAAASGSTAARATSGAGRTSTWTPAVVVAPVESRAVRVIRWSPRFSPPAERERP